MKYAATCLGFAALAAAHGYVDNATIGGEEYTFYQPYLDPYMDPAPERVSRPIQGNGPVTDMSLIDIQCGGYSAGDQPGSSPAPISATAEAGSNVTLHWTLWPSSHFGPTMTYMARCPGDCTQYLPGKEAVWFKIAEHGQNADGSWATDPLTQPGNDGYTYTIPECLKPGHYVVRHELFAMHAAPTQVFPGCHQLKVTGDGDTVPSDLVSFPGAYTNENVEYDPSKESYAIPGPEVFTC
ncbi:endoglucanase IV precursor [Hortaea werneckii]|nr:endoglucanase IV precursor [Hortaea werneckii]KAI7063489.1 endoglucanase IV precursor [Hortaea werneckii]KAI7212265.1 endoglucanase IV precursor [Hortaea werneckii]KAI7294163.1 endoglucanase IV precursor [Hortaea werneckii]KAI7372560.1 endoglucanase IV precursor [Hortaea werneckii]